MKTNHRRGFVDRRARTGFIALTKLGTMRVNRYKHGKVAAVHDIDYGGHREFAAAVRAVKTTIRRSERRALKERLERGQD